MPFKTEPRIYQRDTHFASWKEEKFALFWEMGLGKSKLIIDGINELFAHAFVSGAIIIADKGNYLNWKAEFEKHSFTEFQIGVYRAGMGDKASKELRRICTDATLPLKVMLMNVEAFSSESPTYWVQMFCKHHKTIMVVDESTSIKNYTAKRTKRLTNLGKLARFKRIMTGTPVTNNPLDLFGQMRFLDPAILGYDNFVAFRARYAIVKQQILGNRTFPLIIGWQNQAELARSIAPYSSRLLKKDVLDLPEKTYLKREVPHSPEQAAAYKEMLKQMEVILPTDEATAAWAIVQVTRLRQINTGYLQLDSGVVARFPHGRIEALMRVIEEAQGSIVIWATYQYEVEEICEALWARYGREQAVHYYGLTSQDEREHALKAFQSGVSRFFVGTPATGGKGLTLTAASVTVYYSNDYKLEARLQSEDRIHRIGQKNTCVYVDLVTPGSIDETILSALLNKQDLASNLLGLLKRQAKLTEQSAQRLESGNSVGAAGSVLPNSIGAA